MQIQVHTDNHIKGSEELTQRVESIVEGALDRFRDRITRVDVHLTDANSSTKAGGHDMRCAIEARLAGMQPIAVHHAAATLDQALEGSAEKLESVLEHTLGRLGEHKGRTPYGGEPKD